MNRKRVPRRQMGMSVKAIIFYGDKFLILEKNDREGKHPWEFPGGGLEYGEDFTAALRREVEEETGLQVEILGPIGLWNYRRSSWQHLTGVIFACRAKTDQVRLSKEHLAYRWLLPSELNVSTLHASLQRALAKLNPQGLREAAALAAKLTEGRKS